VQPTSTLIKQNDLRVKTVQLVRSQYQEAPAASHVVPVKQARLAPNVWLESFVLAVTMILLSVILANLDYISQKKVKEVVSLACQENFKIR
jgi:hypothetical protein